MDNKRIKIVYMSVSGNVRSFTHRLQEYATQQHHLNNENPLIELLEISEETLPTKSDSKFFVLLVFSFYFFILYCFCLFLVLFYFRVLY